MATRVEEPMMHTLREQGLQDHGLQEGARITFTVGRPPWWKLLLIVPLIRWLRARRRSSTAYYVRSVSSNCFTIESGPNG